MTEKGSYNKDCCSLMQQRTPTEKEIKVCNLTEFDSDFTLNWKCFSMFNSLLDSSDWDSPPSSEKGKEEG